MLPEEELAMLAEEVSEEHSPGKAWARAGALRGDAGCRVHYARVEPRSGRARARQVTDCAPPTASNGRLAPDALGAHTSSTQTLVA